MWVLTRSVQDRPTNWIGAGQALDRRRSRADRSELGCLSIPRSLKVHTRDRALRVLRSRGRSSAVSRTQQSHSDCCAVHLVCSRLLWGASERGWQVGRSRSRSIRRPVRRLSAIARPSEDAGGVVVRSGVGVVPIRDAAMSTRTTTRSRPRPASTASRTATPPRGKLHPLQRPRHASLPLPRARTQAGTARSGRASGSLALMASLAVGGRRV
jgi:hypothetical protein